MAKERMVNTRFWIDDYISELDPTEKLLFLYILTNPMTDICGVYEMPVKIMAVETGIDKDMVLKVLKRFEEDKKVFYQNGWVAIKNFAKHQKNNPKVKRGIEIGLSKAPKELVDRLLIDYDRLSHSNLNSNLNPKYTEQSSETPIKKEEKEDVPFILEEYLEKMKVDKNNHVRLISYFITRKELAPGTVAEMGEIIRRNAKIAKRIADTYSKSKIAKAFDICIEKHSDIDWGLETVYKKLTNSNL